LVGLVSNRPFVAILVDPFLLEYMTGNIAHCTVLVRDADDPRAARRGLEAARLALSSLRHPEEPTDPLSAWVSEVEATPEGLQFWFDAADVVVDEGVFELVLDAIVAALAGSGVGVAVLTHPPEPGVLPGLPPSPAGWPDDLPLPEPRQELYVSTTQASSAMAFMVPHGAESLMGFFEAALPAKGYEVILSVDLDDPSTTYVGRVFFRCDDHFGQVAVTDTGGSRHVEIELHHDASQIRSILAQLGSRESTPDGLRLRIDNRY
jgi:hypothetical protein